MFKAETAVGVRTRRGSKTSQILNILQKEKEVRRKNLMERIPSAGSAIQQLIRKKAIERELRKIPVSGDHLKILHDRFIDLNIDQENVVEKIVVAINSCKYTTFLLFGVTGSGKTEVYLYAVKEAIQRGKSALILIPEISLTPQAVSRFRERFGDRVAILHSGMSIRQRRVEWWKIKERRCDIVIGARSAIFAPLSNIGLIVVDEEHDSSYKQQETPFYNSRDAAVKIASDQNAVVILGSATPSIESFNNAETGKYSMLLLPKRANQKPLPHAEVINLKEERRQTGVFYLSRYLVTCLRENLNYGKQALIFLNRRGYASFLSCKGCELPVLCDNCSIAMTWHQSRNRLICHHCGFVQQYPKICVSCRGRFFKMEGIGTQRVERDLKVLFPRAAFSRMDRDTISGKGVLGRAY